MSMNNEQGFIGLGDLWDGKCIKSVALAPENLNTWVPEGVADAEMSCGGRKSLEAILATEKRGTLRRAYCGSCAVRSSCILGKAVNLK